MNEVDSTGGEGSAPLPPPPAPVGAAAFPARRLYRDPRGPLAGVASGMAGYFEIDPVVVRLLWIVALLTGVGFFAYLVCWVVVPKAPVWPPPGYGTRFSADARGATLASGLLIVALAAWIGKGVNGVGDWLLPAVLVGVGVYLLNQRSLGHRESAGAFSSAAAPDASSEALLPLATSAASPVGVVTPTVLSLLALGTGVCWALHAAGVVQLSVSAVAAGGLLLVGGGLVASLWFGRAPGLILAGLGLVAVLLGAAALEPLVEHARTFQASAKELPFGLEQLTHSAGERHFTPSKLEELQPSYELGMGKLTLDLTQIDFSEVTREVQIQVGMGELTVIVPKDVDLDVTGHVGLGELTALDQHDEGMGSHVEAQELTAGSGTLRVDFHVGVGEGKVRREH